MALTGLFLCLFLIEHLYGNLLLYYSDGGAAFNEYSHTLCHMLLIRIVEFVLFGAIIMHVLQALLITTENNKARPMGYSATPSIKGVSWFSRNMGITGSIVFFFIIVHLYNFFVPYRITQMPEGENLAQMVKVAFQQPLYAFLYFAGVTFLFFHLSHGFTSALHTLGMDNLHYGPAVKMAGVIFSWLMWLGFASFPVFFYFGIAGNTF